MSAILEAVYAGREETLAALLADDPELSIFEAAALGLVERVRELLDEQASLATAYAPDGFTALQLGAHFRRPEVVRLLLERGADFAAVARHEQIRVTALHAAAAGDDGPSARLLVEAGADVHAAQPGGFTALHAAAQNGNTELVELLLEHGADPARTTDEGATPTDLAAQEGHADLARRLAEAG